MNLPFRIYITNRIGGIVMKIVSFRVKKMASAPHTSLFEGLNRLWRRVSGRSRRAMCFCAALLMLLALFPLSAPGQAVAAAVSKRQLPIYCVKKDSKVVSLSFDAAWGNEDTEQLIEILGKYGVSATFFVVGAWVEKYPESVRALHDAGHEIMNHSDDHAHYPKLTADEMTADLARCNDKIEAVTGVRPTLFRPPYGDYNDKVISAVRESGMQAVQWDVDSLDWKGLSADKITARVLERVGPGSIVLFHNAAEHTPAALPGIIEGLIQQGFGFLPLSKLILTEGYEIDHTGRQYPA